MTSFRLFLGLGLVIPCLGVGCEIHDIAIGGDAAGAGGVGSSGSNSSAGEAGQTATAPCANAACGDSCSTCDPDAAGKCTLIDQWCNADGECTPEDPQCPGEDPPEPGCVSAGCSGELCVSAEDADVASECVWLDEYACYEGASCELQSDGACGWTPTDELTSCIEEARNGSSDPPTDPCENAECGAPCSTCDPDASGGCDDVMEYCNADGECSTAEPQCPGEDPSEPVCVSAGCSGQLCVDQESAGSIITTCEWLDEYACYENTPCELQPDGACGWTPTDELTACIEEARNGSSDPPTDPCENAECGTPCSTCIPDESGACDTVMEYCNADGECSTAEPQCPGEDPSEPGCVSAGCSGELCVSLENADVASECVWLDEYACYEGASCELQSDGACGWTPTDELTSCIEEARNGSSDPPTDPCENAECGTPCSTCNPDASGGCDDVMEYCNADGECSTAEPQCSGEDPSEPVCVSAGCSGELCVSLENADATTDCVWLDEYACYEGASCELQSDGACGWTPTDELTSCIEEARNGSAVPPTDPCENAECGAPCSTCVPDESGACDTVMEYCNADGECSTAEPLCPDEDPSEPVCVSAGCSGELCVSLENADIVTDCLWRDEYACYEGASCEVQADGECGWTLTEELSDCLAEATGTP